MKLLVGTGLRLGEAEDLTPNRLGLGNGEARAMIEDAKSDDGIRPVFLPEWVAQSVVELLDEHDRSGQDRVFQIPRRTVQKEHNRTRKRIGRPGYTIHDHCHTAAVHLARAGMPLNLLQQQLGHSEIEMTMRYARFHPDYADVQEYFQTVGQKLGLSRKEDDADVSERIQEAAELLDVEAGAMAALVADSGNNTGNTPSQTR